MWGALLIGFLGSLHCVGMCGAITLLIPRSEGSSRIVNILIYNTGRIITYVLLGIIAGIAGEGLIMAGIQKYVTLATGILLLMVVAGGRDFHSFPFFAPVSKLLQPYWQKVLRLPARLSSFVIGLMNGLIPCGMVYIALGGALLAGGVAKSALFMLCFGIGTAPAMLLTATTGSHLLSRFRTKAPAMMVMVLALSGCWLIYRALYSDLYAAFTGITPPIPVCH